MFCVSMNLVKDVNTEFELTIIDQIVMGRYNQDKPIIATTNYLFKDQNNQHNFNVDLTKKQMKLLAGSHRTFLEL